MGQMEDSIKNVLIVGGGAAGWLAAGIIAAGHRSSLQVTLVESPDVPTIGVGEGTWPTMRETLRRIGVSEKSFLKECDASFKQGTKFVGWQNGDHDEFYYHPFSLPQGFLEVNSVPYWQARMTGTSFASAVSPQQQICEHALAPKQAATPDFAAVVNYGYHLDAAKFGLFLRDHCVSKLGVTHVSDHVESVNQDQHGYLTSVRTKLNGTLSADLFIDCTGSTGLLIGKQLGRPMRARRQVLFNDRALAVQVPYQQEDQAIASATVSTAMRAGWVWDIGLPTRRGVGYVYSSAHSSDEQADSELRAYLRQSMSSSDVDQCEFRKLSFEPGHRDSFWHKNCVAVGMSAGFIEPLEASALALVELSVAMIRDDMPANREVMDIVARRFNERFRYRWDRIIDFLKLHYVLSKRRDTAYWNDHRSHETVPERLRELLALWEHRAPARLDFFQAEEIFPAASYQYVLYGMGFKTNFSEAAVADHSELARKHIAENARLTEKALQGLPTNRELLAQIAGV